MTDLSFKGGLFAMNLVCISHSLTRLISNTVSKGNQQFTFRNVTIENAVTVSSINFESKRRRKRKKIKLLAQKALALNGRYPVRVY